MQQGRIISVWGLVFGFRFQGGWCSFWFVFFYLLHTLFRHSRTLELLTPNLEEYFMGLMNSVLQQAEFPYSNPTTSLSPHLRTYYPKDILHPITPALPQPHSPAPSSRFTSLQGTRAFRAQLQAPLHRPHPASSRSQDQLRKATKNGPSVHCAVLSKITNFALPVCPAAASLHPSRLSITHREPGRSRGKGQKGGPTAPRPQGEPGTAQRSPASPCPSHRAPPAG